MADTPKALREAAPGRSDALRDARIVLANRAAQASSVPRIEDVDVIQVLEQRIDVARRRALTGIVRVSTTTEAVERTIEVDLDRYRVEVTRVPVGRVVDGAPVARTEGDITVIPVVEERLVLVKQLFLVEEVRIRHVLERETVSEPVTLRRQRAVVERLVPEGGIDAQRASEGDGSSAEFSV